MPHRRACFVSVRPLPSAHCRLPPGIAVADDRPKEGAPKFVPTIAFMDTNLDQRRHRGLRGPYRRHSIDFKRAVVELR